MDTITITAHDVIGEFSAWLTEQPASPARTWCTLNWPTAAAAQRALSTQRLTQRFLRLLYPPRICTFCDTDISARATAQPVLYGRDGPPEDSWMCLDETGCERRQKAQLRTAFAGWGPFGAELQRAFRPQPLMLERGQS
jgi:hypothetical protein